jgi:hypothetical protein
VTHQWLNLNCASLDKMSDSESQLVKLVCLVVEEDTHRVFDVQIELSGSVNSLKDAIKLEMPITTFNNIPAEALDLAKVKYLDLYFTAARLKY